MATWVDVAVGVGSVVTTLPIGALGFKWLVKRSVADVMAPLDERLDRMELSLATQFGGNGGGMREAINKQGRQISYILGALHLREDEVA